MNLTVLIGIEVQKFEVIDLEYWKIMKTGLVKKYKRIVIYYFTANKNI